MKPRFLFLGSTGYQPVAFGRWPNAWQRKHAKWCNLFAASCRELPRKLSGCSLECRMRRLWQLAGPLVFIAFSMAGFVHQASAVTLDAVLQTTLEKNPVIQEAKSNLEQAAGQRLVLRSIMWPDAKLQVPAGVQGGQRAGQGGTKGFAFARGVFSQALFNAAIPPSRRRGDVELLIAKQRLNVAVMEQLHAARVWFYTALYNRSLESIRTEQRQRLDENVATQQERYNAGLTDRSALASATVEARELDAQIEGARRAYAEGQLGLAQAMGRNPATMLPEPEGELPFAPMIVDVRSETAVALERRADLKLARLLVRATNEDQRIIEAGYYPEIAARITGTYIPITRIHREGSTRRTDDITSEMREGAIYTWRVIDNGKVGGAVLRARAARETNELTCQKLEADVGRELARIANNLKAIEARERSLAEASDAAQESARVVQQNLASGLASPLEYRVTQNGFLETRSGLLDAIYQHNLAVADWERATGRYFQFSDDTAQNVH